MIGQGMSNAINVDRYYSLWGSTKIVRNLDGSISVLRINDDRQPSKTIDIDSIPKLVTTSTGHHYRENIKLEYTSSTHSAFGIYQVSDYLTSSEIQIDGCECWGSKTIEEDRYQLDRPSSTNDRVKIKLEYMLQALINVIVRFKQYQKCRSIQTPRLNEGPFHIQL